MTGRSVALFAAAAIAEIGGAYLVWVGIMDHRSVAFVALGAMALTAYGVIAAFQPQPRVRACAGFRPDRSDALGALICLVGVAVMMYARRAGLSDPDALGGSGAPCGSSRNSSTA